MTRTLLGMTVAVTAAVMLSACRTPSEPTPTEFVVLNEAGQLACDCDLLVNTDRGRTEWLTPGSDGLQAAFPSGQVWGFIAAVKRGNTTLGSRPGVDMSAYRTLQMQLRGTANGSVDVGIKDATDPDTGVESRRSVNVTTSWQPVSFNLSDFTTAEKTRIYLFFELVFSGSIASTVLVRDVRYLP
jgi:hypothetical protein